MGQDPEVATPPALLGHLLQPEFREEIELFADIQLLADLQQAVERDEEAGGSDASVRQAVSRINHLLVDVIQGRITLGSTEWVETAGEELYGLAAVFGVSVVQTTEGRALLLASLNALNWSELARRPLVDLGEGAEAIELTFDEEAMEEHINAAIGEEAVHAIDSMTEEEVVKLEAALDEACGVLGPYMFDLFWLCKVLAEAFRLPEEPEGTGEQG